MEKQRPKVGIGVYILNDKSQVLLLKEHRADTGDTWASPGGHLEIGEEFIDCVKREVREETGMEVLDAELWAINNNIALPDWHYVNLDFLVKTYRGEPKIMEPGKCKDMRWFNLNDLPAPLLNSSKNFFARNPPCLCRSGKKFKDCHAIRLDGNLRDS